MDDKEKIEAAKLMTEEDDDDLVAFYLENAKEVIFHQIYPYATDDMEVVVPTRYDMLQCRIASHFINKRGAEGELHHSENGVLRIYGSEDVPNSMLREIVPKAVVL